VRSKSVKLIAQITANKQFVDRNLRSEDPRIRANAIEGLWGAVDGEATKVFQAATSDPHPRVVVNALIGSYIQGDSDAFRQLLQLAEHSAPAFRSAVVWAFGYINDAQAVSALRTLAQDSDAGIRLKAGRLLKLFAPRHCANA
jgi:HEAT repeat protein